MITIYGNVTCGYKTCMQFNYECHEWPCRALHGWSDLLPSLSDSLHLNKAASNDLPFTLAPLLFLYFVDRALTIPQGTRERVCVLSVMISET